jgi:divalent metal cation (Fe/Co/Zn/Cd) transporter
MKATTIWAIQASALLSGIGIGLFINEVGKFITQTNDYFFPPALSHLWLLSP